MLNGIVSATMNSSSLADHLSAQFVGGAAIVVVSTMIYHAAPTVHGCQMAKFDPFLSLDCARVEGVGAQSKERKGSNFAA